MVTGEALNAESPLELGHETDGRIVALRLLLVELAVVLFLSAPAGCQVLRPLATHGYDAEAGVEIC